MAGTGIMALLAKPKGGGSKGPPLGGDDAGGGEDEVASALREMFDLLKGGDDSGAALAFRRAKAACDDSYEGDESDGEEMASEDDSELDL